MMMLSSDTTAILSAAFIVLFISITAITVPDLLMRLLALVLAMFGIDVGDN
jgi:hypothetical protein